MLQPQPPIAVHRLLRHQNMAQLRAGFQYHERSLVQNNFITTDLAGVWFISGKGTLTINEITYPLQAGSFFLRRPHQAHDVYADAGSAWYYMAIPAAAYFTLQQCLQPGLEKAVHHLPLRRELQRRWQYHVDKLQRSHGQLLARCASEMQTTLCDMLMQDQQHNDPRLDHAASILARDLSQPMEMATVAKTVGFSYPTFRKAFSQQFACAPKQWRIQRRLERAQDLLAKGHTLEIIAEELGFVDATAFSKQFTHHLGMSPGRMRKLLGVH